MLAKIKPAVLVTACVVALGLALAWGQDQPLIYVKNAMCIACHKGRNPGLVDRYQGTKHAQVTPADGMAPVDIYRRSVGFHSADNSYYQAGVGCQDCHEPGGAHLKAHGDDEKRATMKRVDALEKPSQKLSVCGRCHGDYTVNGKPFAENFNIGDDLFAMDGFKLNPVTTPGPFQELNDLQSSKHGANNVTCITCHTSHEDIQAAPQLRKPVPDLCLQCHAKVHNGAGKPAGAPDTATCTTCHMPGGRHTFAIPK